MEKYIFESGPINDVSWGRFKIFGKEHYKRYDGTIVGAGKDIRIYKGEVSPWKERDGHFLTEDMITGVEGCEILIIGNGFNGAITLSNEIYKRFKNLIVKRTPQACRLFNKLYSEGKNVALLAHGTC